MTPDDFRHTVLPDVLQAWNAECFCRNPGFLKLLSFNCEDYDIGPVALADSEILIDEIIRRRFHRVGEPSSHRGFTTQDYSCPKCQRTCKETYAECSINMYCSYVSYKRSAPVCAEGIYLVGFYGFSGADFGKIHDFRPATTKAQFISSITAT